ncbi:hypothetical protein E2562_009735 [Oryza meyeriana var. granulata]|uniref:Uncharacterized protein n=1 Tax=Oryza meyeriana var. granulata TaxID=110450 RepID=A0A6G1D1W3_9ORYZ|nr:hypothetical protein E2562_009735 [Oryza meyeriana var. granulata]
MKETFEMPPEAEELMKHHAMIKAGNCGKFKSKLVTKYVLPRKTPFSTYSQITPTEWEEFVAMKSTKEFSDSSEAHR